MAHIDQFIDFLLHSELQRGRETLFTGPYQNTSLPDIHMGNFFSSHHSGLFKHHLFREAFQSSFCTIAPPCSFMSFSQQGWTDCLPHARHWSEHMAGNKTEACLALEKFMILWK